MKLQVVKRLAIIGNRGRRHPERTLTQIDLVQVELQNAFLLQGAPNSNGKNPLANLPDQRGFARQQHVLRHLLRNGRRTLQATPRDIVADIANHGLENPDRIHTGMHVEVLVLGADERLLDQFRDFLDRREDPVFLCEHRHCRAVGRMNPSEYARFVRDENRVIGQVTRIPPHACGDDRRTRDGKQCACKDQPLQEAKHGRSSTPADRGVGNAAQSTTQGPALARGLLSTAAARHYI